MRRPTRERHPVAAFGSAILNFCLVAGLLAAATGIIG